MKCSKTFARNAIFLCAVTAASGSAQAQFNTYVASQGTTTVRVLDATNSEVASISGTGTRNLILSADGRRLFSMTPNAFQVIDTQTRAVLASVATGNNVVAVAETNRGFLYTCNNASGTVSIVDPATYTVTGTLPLPCLTAVATPDGSAVWVTTFGPLPTFAPTIAVIDAATNAVATTFTVTGHGNNAPSWLAFTPDGAYAYAVFSSAGRAVVYDTATHAQVAAISVGTAPNYVAISPDGSRAYVANLTGNSISIIDTATLTVTSTVAVGTLPRAVAFSASGAYAYVTNFSSNSISVIDTATASVATTLSTASRPWGIVAMPDNDHDGVAQNADNCPFTANPSQSDVDGDGIGDACDDHDNRILDDFDREDGALGPNWTGFVDAANYAVAGETCQAIYGGPIYWSAGDPLGTSQEAFVTFTAVDATGGLDHALLLKVQSDPVPANMSTDPDWIKGTVAVSYNAADHSVYVATWRPDTNAWNVYASQALTMTDGDVFGARVLSDGTIEVYRNAVLALNFALDAGDQAFFNDRGGRVGLWIEQAAFAQVDDFGGATLPEGGPGPV